MLKKIRDLTYEEMHNICLYNAYNIKCCNCPLCLCETKLNKTVCILDIYDRNILLSDKVLDKEVELPNQF